MICLNCENEFEGKFCNNCGQTAGVEKITVKGVLIEFFKLISNSDKGLWYTMLNLTRKPQKTIEEFLQGKRKPLLKPIQYVILGLTLLILVDNFFGVGAPFFNIGDSETVQFYRDNPKFGFEAGQKIGRVTKIYLKYFLLLNVFMFAFPAKLFFKQYTFAEHVTIQAFIIGQSALITVVLFPLMNWRILINPVFLLSLWILNALMFRQKGRLFESILASFFIIMLGYLLFCIPPIMISIFFDN